MDDLTRVFQFFICLYVVSRPFQDLFTRTNVLICMLLWVKCNNLQVVIISYVNINHIGMSVWTRLSKNSRFPIFCKFFVNLDQKVGEFLNKFYCKVFLRFAKYHNSLMERAALGDKIHTTISDKIGKTFWRLISASQTINCMSKL